MFYIIALLSFVSLIVSVVLGNLLLFIASVFILGAISAVYLLLIHARTYEIQHTTAQSRLLPLSNTNGTFFVEELLINGETTYKINPLLIGLPNPIPASNANISQNLECGAARIDECTTYTKHSLKISRIMWMIFFFSNYVVAKKNYEIYIFPGTMLN